MAPADPRLRLVAALLAIAGLSQIRSLAVALPVLGLVAVTVLAGAPDRRIWRRLLHVEGFLLLLCATLPFTMGGEALLTLGPLTARDEGLWRALLIAAKVSASVLLLVGFLGDMEPARLGPVLRDLRVPDRLARLFVLTVRYGGLLRDEARRLHDAMRARGFRPRSNRHTWQSYGNLIGMLLVRALDRAGRVEEAMRCRGHDGRFPSGTWPAPPARDWARLAGVAGAAVLALLADRL